MKKFFGALVLALGVCLLAWIAYNLFIEMQPQAAGRNPIPAVLLSAAFIYVGQKWLRGQNNPGSKQL